MNLFDRIAYDTGGYTVQEILSSFCKKILEIIELVNKNEEVCDEAHTLIENIRNEVVPDLVDDIIEEMQDNGYFDSLVNVTLIDNLRTELTTLLNQTITDFTTRLDNFDTQLFKLNAKPYFVDGFGSFSRFGYGVPSGISNYSGGNYVLRVNGNVGDSFVTVINGDISHGGGVWACVVEDNDGIYHLNKVVSIDGNKLNLIEPLQVSISNTRLGNLHDTQNGQHYTELGYFAFAQHIYYNNPKHCYRQKYIAMFKGSNKSGNWKNNGYTMYNVSSNPTTTSSMYFQYGSKALELNCTSINNYLEWEVNLSKKSGYVEAFIGSEKGIELTVEFYLDNRLVESKNIAYLNRVIFDFSNASIGKIKVKPKNAVTSSFKIKIGNVTWWENENNHLTTLLDGFKNIAYIGDSWGVFHNKATTRELTRLLGKEVKNYSKTGHSCIYAKEWFNEYIIKNKHDCVIIEYFTNDFNSIKGANLGEIINPNGESINMNLTSLVEYENIINELIDTCINNGVQPIIVQPFSTNSDSQSLSFADFSVDLYQGISSVGEEIELKKVTSPNIITKEIITNTGENLTLTSTAINSSERKGVIINSSENLTGGSIAKIQNNSIDKFDFRFDGGLRLTNIKLTPITNYNEIALTEGNRGLIFFVDESVHYGGGDAFYTVVKEQDGTLVRKKLSLS